MNSDKSLGTGTLSIVRDKKGNTTANYYGKEGSYTIVGKFSNVFAKGIRTLLGDLSGQGGKQAGGFQFTGEGNTSGVSPTRYTAPTEDEARPIGNLLLTIGALNPNVSIKSGDDLADKAAEGAGILNEGAGIAQDNTSSSSHNSKDTTVTIRENLSNGGGAFDRKTVKESSLDSLEQTLGDNQEIVK